jgi:hypothetical protein
MQLTRALSYLDLGKSSYSYERRPRSKDKRVFPLDEALAEALQEMTCYERARFGELIFS